VTKPLNSKKPAPSYIQNRKAFTLVTCHMSRSIRIAEDVRKYAVERGVAEEAALKTGLEQKATEFTKSGAELYTKL
jgi:hypothetical protein